MPETLETLVADQPLRVWVRGGCAGKEAYSIGIASLESRRNGGLPWLNHQRLLEPIGYIPPAEAELNYYQQLAEKAAVEV